MVHPPPEDVRSARPYLLRRNPLKAFARRAVSIAALIAIDVTGLTIGLYIALVLRSVVRDPSPILWNLLWKAEADWLPFLVLLTVLVFWRNRLYGQRELREGAGRIVPSVLLVTALALAFAIGTDQHFTTFGLYLVAAIAIATMISLLRWSYETLTGSLMRSFGVRRRVLLVGDKGQTEHLRDTIGRSRSGIDYQFAGHVPFGPEVLSALQAEYLDEVIVADDGIDETELLEIVDQAHRRGVRVRIAPRTTQLLVDRGEYVPGQAVPIFDVRPPILAGADWALKRTFDLVIATLIIVIGLPLWLLIALVIKVTSRGPVFYADDRVGLGERSFRMLKFRTMVAGAAGKQAALEQANEATGRSVQDPQRPARDHGRSDAAALLARRDPERDQRAARPDVAGRSASAPAARLRPARALAPAPLERPARDDRPLADRRPQRPHLRRPRAPRLLLPRELVALARPDDPRPHDPCCPRPARRVLIMGEHLRLSPMSPLSDTSHAPCERDGGVRRPEPPASQALRPFVAAPADCQPLRPY